MPDDQLTAAADAQAGLAHVATASLLASRVVPTGGYAVALAGGVALARAAQVAGRRRNCSTGSAPLGAARSAHRARALLEQVRGVRRRPGALARAVLGWIVAEAGRFATTARDPRCRRCRCCRCCRCCARAGTIGCWSSA